MRFSQKFCGFIVLVHVCCFFHDILLPKNFSIVVEKFFENENVSCIVHFFLFSTVFPPIFFQFAVFSSVFILYLDVKTDVSEKPLTECLTKEITQCSMIMANSPNIYDINFIFNFFFSFCYLVCQHVSIFNIERLLQLDCS